jgi:Flp pilus assembly protein TadB
VSEPASTQDADQQPVGKGRPTPKRSEARKQRRKVGTPANRKEAAKLRRDRMREQRTNQRQALLTGDERYLPPRDAGPGRRLARDHVDSRFTVGQVFFGLVFVALGVSLAPNTILAAYANLLMLVVFIVVVVNCVMVGRAAKREVEEKYGEDAATGITAYAGMRAMQPRRMRRPPPRVKRGGEPV